MGFSCPIFRLKPHQWYACRRGESHGILSTSVALTNLDHFGAKVQNFLRISWYDHDWCQPCREACTDGIKRLLHPSIQREIKRQLHEQAEDSSLDTFRRNLVAKVLQPPMCLWGSEETLPVLAIDPGFANGCKMSTVSATGSVIRCATMNLRNPSWGRQMVMDLCQDVEGGYISIGNGTASRETEAFIRGLLHELPVKGYAVIDEGGASVYSASELASKELPDVDVTLRGAVSIARRLQDPLSEYFKIEPSSLGVGLYQSDVDKKRMAQELKLGVEFAVNRVGVDVNTASAVLLGHVSGLNATLCQRIIAMRDEKPIQSRADLRKVKGMGPRTFTNAAGFLRVHGSECLDATGIHPEDYEQVRRMMAMQSKGSTLDKVAKVLKVSLEKVEEWQSDLLNEDVRKQEPTPRLCSADDTAQQLDDSALAVGMVRDGIVRNITAFGAFIDIGAHSDGLLHVSQVPFERRHQQLYDWVKVNQVLKVRIDSLEKRGNKLRISLTMRQASATPLQPIPVPQPMAVKQPMAVEVPQPLAVP